MSEETEHRAALAAGKKACREARNFFEAALNTMIEEGRINVRLGDRQAMVTKAVCVPSDPGLDSIVLHLEDERDGESDWTVFAQDEHRTVIAIAARVLTSELGVTVDRAFDDERVTHVEVHDGSVDLD